MYYSANIYIYIYNTDVACRCVVLLRVVGLMISDAVTLLHVPTGDVRRVWTT